jgi:hypothetical protein
VIGAAMDRLVLTSLVLAAVGLWALDLYQIGTLL